MERCIWCDTCLSFLHRRWENTVPRFVLTRSELFEIGLVSFSNLSESIQIVCVTDDVRGDSGVVKLLEDTLDVMVLKENLILIHSWLANSQSAFFDNFFTYLASGSAFQRVIDVKVVFFLIVM